jgi:hypothetical protein
LNMIGEIVFGNGNPQPGQAGSRLAIDER